MTRALAPLLLGLALSGCGAKVVLEGDTAAGGSGASPSRGGLGLREEVVVSSEDSSSVSIDVDARTLGVIATLESDAPNDRVAFRRVRAPSGDVVVESPLAANTYDWAFYGAVAIAAPQVDHPASFPLAQGTWTFELESDAPSHASLWRRSTEDGLFHGGVLDVNVFVPDGLVAEDEVLATLAVAFDDWAGVALGDVRFFPLPDRFFVVDDDNVFDLLAETGAVTQMPALNVMATAAIGGSYEGAAGFSLGIPGTTTLPGSNAGAVVWMVLHDDFYDPLVLRHEAGHLAGLFHTTELVVGLADPLDDTPVCADAAALLEACPDFGYTMFPSGGSGQGLFSAKEQAIVQASAIYRGVYRDGDPPTPPFGPPAARAPAPFSEDARAAARRRAAEAPGRARRAPWRSRLARADAAELLAGVGCPMGGVDVAEAARERATPDELAALAADPDAPAYVRRRAALAAAR